MVSKYSIRRKFEEIVPFLAAVTDQADKEREALGFLPGAAYPEAAQQNKLMVLLASDGINTEYAGHLLFGGVFPFLRVRQICIAPRHRGKGGATMLLRALKSRAETEGYLSIVANVASDLEVANAFYEKNGFTTQRLKAGGATRQRIINVRTLDLQTPSLLSLMSGASTTTASQLIQSKKRLTDTPLYAIDLNVFFDAVKKRAQSEDAGAVFQAALRHQIKITASDEFVRELERRSSNRSNDPILALAKQIPNLPSHDSSMLHALIPEITSLVFPERASKAKLKDTDKSDVLHLAHAICAGVAGYITSDSKILSARDQLMSRFGIDVIGLSEFVELLDLPVEMELYPKRTEHFQISPLSIADINQFLEQQNVSPNDFLDPHTISECDRLCVSDHDGIIGISISRAAHALNESSRLVVCVNQQHAFSSTVADYLISEQIHVNTQKGASTIALLDIISHPITRRIATSHGFQPDESGSSRLFKVALGYPVTKSSWNKARLAVERLGSLKLGQKHPKYDNPKITVASAANKKSKVDLFDLETLLSPTLFALPRRECVVVPITAEFANALLGTDLQYTFLDVPEAQFLSRRTYFNTIRAAQLMKRGSAIVFYESSRSGGRAAIVAVGRIIEVTSILVDKVPEFMQRAAVVDDPGKITKSKRVLATVFDNLLPLKTPVSLKVLRQIGCAPKSNFISATHISSTHLEKIVLKGFGND